jgi:hypothetical protein
MKKNASFSELNEVEAQKIQGGNFAYDFGTFLRELYVGITAGPSTVGIVTAVSMDLTMTYRPVK